MKRDPDWISAVLRDFAYWPRGGLQPSQGVAIRTSSTILAKTLAIPAADDGAAWTLRERAFSPPRDTAFMPCRRRWHDHAEPAPTDPLLLLDEQQAA